VTEDGTTGDPSDDVDGMAYSRSQVVLGPEAWDVVMDLIDHPPEPTDALRALMAPRPAGR
jgi:uncharacterized protein (DUF1778 family)